MLLKCSDFKTKYWAKKGTQYSEGGASAPLASPQIRHYSLLSNYLAHRIHFSNGPNDVWNYDGYDKIKQNGFPIHGVVFKEDFMIKNSQIKQQPYGSSGFVFKCKKRAGFLPKSVKGRLWI